MRRMNKLALGLWTWTLLLLPLLSAYYLDDEGAPQAVYINGQNGTISGVRRSSMKRAQRASLWI